MKLLLAVLLTMLAASAPANEMEMLSLPRGTAEEIVKENLRLHGVIEGLNEQAAAMLKHIQKLQTMSNCV